MITLTFREFDILSHSPYFKPYIEHQTKQPEIKKPEPLSPASTRWRKLPGKKKSKKSKEEIE